MQRRIFRSAAQTVEQDPAPPIFCQAQIVITTRAFGAEVTLRTEVFDILPRSEAPQLFKFDLCQRAEVSAPFDLIAADFGLPVANANNDAANLTRTRLRQPIDRFQIIAAFYLLAHPLFPVHRPLMSDAAVAAKDMSLVAMPHHNYFARLGAVFDFQVTLGGFGQRKVHGIEQPAHKFYRQFVAQVTGAGEQRELGLRVPSSERLSMFALVVQDRCGDARRVSALFGQTEKLVCSALPY